LRCLSRVGGDMDERRKKTIFFTTRTRFANRLVVAGKGVAMAAWNRTQTAHNVSRAISAAERCYGNYIIIITFTWVTSYYYHDDDDDVARTHKHRKQQIIIIIIIIIINMAPQRQCRRLNNLVASRCSRCSNSFGVVSCAAASWLNAVITLQFRADLVSRARPTDRVHFVS